jgi:hypothetical protein
MLVVDSRPSRRRAAAKALEASNESVARKTMQLVEMGQKKRQAQQQTGEIIGSKTELDTIYDEARKHRDTAGDSMRKLRGEYAERLNKSTKMQEMAKGMKRRIGGGLGPDLDDGEQSAEAAQKKLKLSDANRQLESEISELTAHSDSQALELQTSFDEQEEKNATLKKTLDSFQLDRAKFEMLTKTRVKEMDNLADGLQQSSGYRDGVNADLEAMTKWNQKAAVMQEGA